VLDLNTKEKNMAIYGADGMREVRAQREYECEGCGGSIFRRELYWNYHSALKPGNWRGRRHLDCGAAWWQGETVQLLSAVALLPGANPPSLESEPILKDIPFSIVASGDQVHVSVSFADDYQERLLHTKNLDIRREAFGQIGRAVALTADCIVAVSGNRRKAQQISNLLQQMAIIAGIPTPADGRSST